MHFGGTLNGALCNVGLYEGGPLCRALCIKIFIVWRDVQREWNPLYSGVYTEGDGTCIEPLYGEISVEPPLPFDQENKVKTLPSHILQGGTICSAVKLFVGCSM